ncbi:MAG: hypothetical protein ABSH26_18195 [Opitutaceae bacterium]
MIELPREHAGAAARLSDPPDLGGTILRGRQATGSQAAATRFAADEFFNLDRTVAVHEISRVVDRFA